MNIKTCLEHCKLLRPVWTLTYQHCTRPTICSTAHPPSTEDIYYNNDVGAKCLQKLGGDNLKCVYDYIKTEVSILTNIVYICKYLGFTHRIYSSESQSLAYLLGIIRHQRRGQFVTNIWKGGRLLEGDGWVLFWEYKSCVPTKTMLKTKKPMKIKTAVTPTQPLSTVGRVIQSIRQFFKK